LNNFINSLNGMNTSRYTHHGRSAKNRMTPVYWVGGCGLWEASPTKGEINQSVKHYIGEYNVIGLAEPNTINSRKQISQLVGCDKSGLTIIPPQLDSFYPGVQEHPRPKTLSGHGII
jgi:hypothetical protein